MQNITANQLKKLLDLVERIDHTNIITAPPNQIEEFVNHISPFYNNIKNAYNFKNIKLITGIVNNKSYVNILKGIFNNENALVGSGFIGVYPFDETLYFFNIQRSMTETQKSYKTKEQIQKELDNAVIEENYEKAAELKKELDKTEKNK